MLLPLFDVSLESLHHGLHPGTHFLLILSFPAGIGKSLCVLAVTLS